MLSAFLHQLFEHGRVQVPRPGTDDEFDTEGAVSILASAEAVRQQNMPSGMPEFSTEVALWAAVSVYRAAQYLVFRDTDPQVIQAGLQQRHPSPQTVSEHYSADICLRFMKDILRLSKAASDNDPLNEQILRMMTDWPLSAVGLNLQTHDQILLTHKGMQTIYLDRIMELKDRTALQNDIVKAALKEAAGMHTELLPVELCDNL